MISPIWPARVLRFWIAAADTCLFCVLRRAEDVFLCEVLRFFMILSFASCLKSYSVTFYCQNAHPLARLTVREPELLLMYAHDHREDCP